MEPTPKRQELLRIIQDKLEQAYEDTLENVIEFLDVRNGKDKEQIREHEVAENELKIIDEQAVKKVSGRKENLRYIAYSMDLLIPGLYFWCPYFNVRIGGATPDDNPYKYPGKIHSSTGIGVVLPGYKIFISY